MQVFARIEGGIVAELIEIETGLDEDGNERPPLAARFHPDLVAAMVPVPAGGLVAVGWYWDGEEFDPPPVVPVAPVVPATVSRRQMLLALAAGAVITPAEALAAAITGAVPATIDAVFGALSEGDALAARITWATMAVVERAHPLIDAMIAAGVVTAEQADSLFILAATL